MPSTSVQRARTPSGRCRAQPDPIGRGRDDDGILTARLAQQVHVGLPRAEQASRVVGTRQHNATDALMGHEVPGDIPVLERGQRHQILGYPGLMEGGDQLGRAALAGGQV